MGVVVLVSGGVDSTIACKILEKQGETPIPLFIDYGQLAAKKEWAACKYLLNTCGLPKPTKMNLNGFGKKIKSGITDPTKKIYEEAFLPGRNMLFLLVGMSYAISRKENKIAIGLLKTNIFPDQREEFIVNTNFAFNSTFGENVVILTPLINFTKAEVIKLAIAYNIPLDKTYSCHKGNNKYCGKCISCKEILASGKSDTFPQLSEVHK